MPLIRKVADTDAAGTFYPLQGSQYEYLPFNALLEFAIIEDGTTPGTTGVKATVYSGSDLLMEQSGIDVKAQLNAIYPDDFTLQDVAAAGERIGVQLDSGASMGKTLVVVRITPL